MKTPDNIRSLEIRIRILESKIVEQSSTYDKMQNKMFAIVGLLLTLGGLLTYDAFKINRPDNTVEWIVLIAALILLAITSIVVAYDYRAKKTWSVPIGAVDDVKLDNMNSYEATVEYIHSDLQIVYQDRDKTLDQKAMYLNTALYLFIISVILLVLLKIGG